MSAAWAVACKQECSGSSSLARWCEHFWACLSMQVSYQGARPLGFLVHARAQPHSCLAFGEVRVGLQIRQLGAQQWEGSIAGQQEDCTCQLQRGSVLVH